MNPDGGGRVGGHPLSSDAKKKGDPNQLRRTDATTAVAVQPDVFGILPRP